MPETRGSGERVSELRKARGETQAEFAKALAVTQPMVSAWEAGSDTPSQGAYLRLGNLASYPDNIWFWEQAGIDGQVMLSAAEKVLKERLADPKAMEDQGKAVFVPPFTQGEWARQGTLPPLLMPAEWVPNKGSTYYLIATSWGGGLAPRDRIVFDTSEASRRRWDLFRGQDVLINFVRPGPGHPLRQRVPQSIYWPTGLSIGRLDSLPESAHEQATHVVFWRRDWPKSAGLSVGETRLIMSCEAPSELFHSRTSRERRDHLLSAHREEVSARPLPEGCDLLGRLVSLVPGGVQGIPEPWNPEVESLGTWIERGCD